MFKKILLPCLVAVAMFSSAISVSAEPADSKVFEFGNVYQYDIDTYEKTSSYNDLKVVIKDEENLDLILDGNTIQNMKYEKQVDDHYQTTLISATGQIDDSNSAFIRLVFDKKENANGNIILTHRKEAQSNETTDTNKGTDIVETKDYIRFAASEPIDLKTLVNGVEKNMVQGVPDPTSIITPTAAGDLPVVKSYKYGNYMYGGVFWNTNYIATGSSVMQLKFVPLYGSLNSWTNPNGRSGTLIKNQSLIISTNATYSFVGSGPKGSTQPTVDNPNNPKNVTIKVSYRGLALGVTFPLNSYNSISPGTSANWNIKNQYLDIINDNGDILDQYYLEGITTITGAGKSCQVSTSAKIDIGALYYFGDIPAQDVVLHDNVVIPNFTASVVSE
ncbi:hypothetical protein [Paenibacillus sp. TH7-28]